MTSTSQPNQELTHVRADGSAHMVDVTEKSVTTAPPWLRRPCAPAKTLSP